MTSDCDCAECKDAKPRPWYQFLIPEFGYRSGDEQNKPSWWFNWFVLEAWSQISCSFDFEFEADNRGIHVALQVLWLRVRVWILKFPNKIEHWLYKHTWRIVK